MKRCRECRVEKPADQFARNGDRQYHMCADCRVGRRGLPVECGDYRMYKKGCRCEECRAANTERTRGLRAVRGERLPAKPARSMGQDPNRFDKQPGSRHRVTFVCELCGAERSQLAFPLVGGVRCQPCRVCVPGGVRPCPTEVMFG